MVSPRGQNPCLIQLWPLWLSPEPRVLAVSAWQYLQAEGSKQERKKEPTQLTDPLLEGENFILCFHHPVAAMFMFTFIVLGAISAAIVRKAGRFRD